MPTYTFSSAERLKSKIAIGQLFKTGKSIHQYPVRIVFIKKKETNSTLYPAQAAFTVPKRSFKRAVKRNRLKRLMREAYRLNKSMLYEKLEKANANMILMLIYTGKEEAKYEEVNKSVQKLLQRLKI